MPRESLVEARLVRAVRLLGGMALKLAPTTKGIPDRLVLLPGGRMFLVELKDGTEPVSPAQRHLHYLMTRLGTDVVVLRGQEEVREWIRSVYEEMDKANGFHPKPGPKPKAKPVSRSRVAYSPEEDAAILATDADSDEILAEQFRRTPLAINRRRQRLLREHGEREISL